MRRREILVFAAAFVVVLLGSAALAQVGAFSADAAAEPATLSVAAAEQAVPTGLGDDMTPAAAIGDSDGPTTTTAESPGTGAEAAVGVPSDPPESDESLWDEVPPAEGDTIPPPLVVLFPESGQHFEKDVIAFEGTTEPGAKVTAGSYEADVDQDGNWRIVLVLSPGGNLVKFKASDAAGNVTEKTLEVYLDEQEAGPEFTAHQKWETVDGYPAKNKYYGTGTPGTTVWVGSEYGAGSTTIGEGGEWAFYVEFPGAPCNDTFPVAVESGEHRVEFSMKYVCAESKFSVHQDYIENTDPWTKFSGTGVPGDTIWAASEYGTEQTTVESSGEWDLKLHFGEGTPANEKVAVVIESSSGDRAEFWFKWVVTDEEVGFTANQKYGSSDADVAWDKFWGTAKPGAIVEVGSPYGGGTTHADEAGNWLIEVEFPDAPIGEEFTVVIETSFGDRATFGFVRRGKE
jgi:hypothetical protein